MTKDFSTAGNDALGRAYWAGCEISWDENRVYQCSGGYKVSAFKNFKYTNWGRSPNVDVGHDSGGSMKQGTTNSGDIPPVDWEWAGGEIVSVTFPSTEDVSIDLLVFEPIFTVYGWDAYGRPVEYTESGVPGEPVGHISISIHRNTNDTYNGEP